MIESRDDNESILNTLQRYHIDDDQWAYLQSMDTATTLAGCGMTNDEQNIYCFGRDTSWNVLDHNHRFHTEI